MQHVDAAPPEAPPPVATTRDSWRDAWARWRDRALTSPGFHRWAQRFPPARWVARRHAGALFDVMAGFVYSQVLLAVVRLGVLARVANDGPQTVEALALQARLPLAACERLVDAAVALRLLDRRGGGRIGLGVLGAPLVAQPGLAAMVEHHEALYRDLADPLALLRAEPGGGHLAAYWGYPGSDRPEALRPGQVAPYSALMSATQPLIAEQVLQAYPLHRHRRLLDLGGGEGAFASAMAQRFSHLQVEVLDLPSVAERANARFERDGLAARCRARGADFFTGPLPQGADLISLVRVLHDHDDAPVAALLRRVRRALPEGGRLLIAEPLADAPGAQAMGSAYFGLYLWAMGQGRPRTVGELTALLHAAGFSQARSLRTGMPLLTGVLVADAGPAVG